MTAVNVVVAAKYRLHRSAWRFVARPDIQARRRSPGAGRVLDLADAAQFERVIVNVARNKPELSQVYAAPRIFYWLCRSSSWLAESVAAAFHVTVTEN